MKYLFSPNKNRRKIEDVLKCQAFLNWKSEYTTYAALPAKDETGIYFRLKKINN